MKSTIEKVMQRPATMGDVAELIGLSLGVMALMSNIQPRAVVSALEQMAAIGGVSKDRATALRYMATRIAETSNIFEQSSGSRH